MGRIIIIFMDYGDPRILKGALRDQNVALALRCLRAGQNPMHFKHYYFNIGSWHSVIPEFLTLLSFHKRIDLTEIRDENYASAGSSYTFREPQQAVFVASD